MLAEYDAASEAGARCHIGGAEMAAESDQDQLIKLARLHLSSPEVVFEELKQQAQRTQYEWASYDSKKIEPSLVERNEPLINLGLASFGANEDVYKALYKHSLTPPQDNADAIYKRGLRVGCLSNQVVPVVHPVFDYPAQLIGASEMHRLITAGDDAEVSALARNPKVSDRFLEALYLRFGPFAEIDEKRWCILIAASSKNERLKTCEDDESGPDLGHYSIQKAIFTLLETAPLDLLWVRVLYNLLLNQNLRYVAKPEKLDSVLNRWATMSDKTRDGKKVVEGYYTNLSLRDEFRCLIAALYGFSAGKMIQGGSVNSTDVALRCAFYGNGELTKKDMGAGYKRDKGAYLLAALFNERIYSQPELKQYFEDEQITFSDLEPRYQENLKLMGRPRIMGAARQTTENKADTRLTNIETITRNLTQKLNGLTAELKDMKRLLFIAAIVVCVLIYFSR